MELEDLKQRWEEHDRKLDMSIRLNTRLLHESVLGKAATALKRLSILVVAGLLFDLGIALWLGLFIADHVEEVRFLVPAVTLQLCIIASIISFVRQLAVISDVDYAAPIITVQKQLEALRVERIRATKWTLLLAPLIWIPFLIVALKALLHVDAYAIFSTAWLAGNVLFGLLLIPLGIWISRRYAGRVERSPLLKRLMRDIAGYNLSAATRFLDRLSQFEDERAEPV